MKSLKVIIIVLHYKNWEDTNECLASLKSLDYDNFETIVIDNDKENPGFAGGNNIGIRQALEKGADPRSSDGASYILLLNNDTVIEPGFLKELVKVGESDKKIGILGPVIYERGSNKVHFAGGKLNWLYTKGVHQKFQNAPRNVKLRNVRRPSETPRSVLASLPSPSATNHARSAAEVRNLSLCSHKIVDYITGACMLVKREVIEKIGLMDEDYFLYFEDADWCLKARRADYKCVLVPNSKIWHKPSSSAIEGSFSYIYYHTRNGLLMTKKNALFFIKTLAYLQSFLIFGKQVIKLILMPSKRKWAKAIMLGIKDFYKGKVGKL